MNWNRQVTAIVMAIAWLTMVGCGDDETSNNTTNNATTNNATTNNATTNNSTSTNNSTTAPLNECEPYEPTEASGTESLMWPEPEAEVQFTITIPDDPGGGWVRLQAVTTNTEISPSLEVQYQDPSGSIVTGSAAGRADEQTTIKFFEAAPGLTYDVNVDQFGNDNADQYPVPVTIDWEFTSVVDCYEPNSTPADAKKIPFDVEIEAHNVAGYRENRFDNPSLSDWYEVTLEEESVIDVDFSQVPSGDRMSIRIFDNPEDPRIGGGSGDIGTPFMATTDDPVPAGTYLIEVVTADAETRNAEFDDTLPSAWGTPYQFTVTASR